MSTLKAALAEKKELESQLVRVNKVIEMLGGELKQGKHRKHNARTRKKMKDAWARRKANAAKPQLVAAGGQDDE